MIKKKNPIWLSGLDPAGISKYLSEHSLSLIEDIGHVECMERYIKPAGRDLTVMEIEPPVLAEVK
jgi:O-methyltransferase involved in polyketide biosynthesis